MFRRRPGLPSVSDVMKYEISRQKMVQPRMLARLVARVPTRLPTWERLGWIIPSRVLRMLVMLIWLLTGLPRVPSRTTAGARRTPLGTGGAPQSMVPSGGLAVVARLRVMTPAALAILVASSADSTVVPATNRAELSTQMIVHPTGIDVPDWIFTTATNRTEKTVEVVGIYIGADASLGVFDWSCSVEDPCPSGSIVPDWQWTRDLTELPCYYAMADDGGGHVVHESAPSGSRKPWRIRSSNPPAARAVYTGSSSRPSYRANSRIASRSGSIDGSPSARRPSRRWPTSKRSTRWLRRGAPA